MSGLKYVFGNYSQMVSIALMFHQIYTEIHFVASFDELFCGKIQKISYV